jgi:hypothetical protein
VPAFLVCITLLFTGFIPVASGCVVFYLRSVHSDIDRVVVVAVDAACLPVIRFWISISLI